MTFYGGPLANYPGAYPEQVIDQVNRDQQTSAFTACAYATGMGFVDICVGAFTATPARDLLSLNLDLWAEPVYLIAPKAQSNGFLQNITKAFSPLTARVWLCVLAFLFVASLLVMVQDFGFQAVEGLFWERIPYLLEAIGYSIDGIVFEMILGNLPIALAYQERTPRYLQRALTPRG